MRRPGCRMVHRGRGVAMTIYRLHRSTLAIAAALVAAVATSPGVHAKEPLLLLRAFAVNLSGGGRAAAGTIDIGIERWTTDEERAKLFNVLVEKGSDRLLDALQDIKPRAGYVRTSRS